MVGEQIGFDEGGVFQALADPIYTRTTVEYTYGKRGDEHKVIEQTTTVLNVTGAHILAAALGPALIALIASTKGLSKEEQGAILASSALLGPFLGPAAVAAIGKLGIPIPSPEERKQVKNWIRRAMDPLGLFD